MQLDEMLEQNERKADDEDYDGNNEIENNDRNTKQKGDHVQLPAKLPVNSEGFIRVPKDAWLKLGKDDQKPVEIQQVLWTQRQVQ